MRSSGDPANRFTTIATSDSSANNIAEWNYIYVGVTGTAVFVLTDGSTVQLDNMAVGWHPIRAVRVNTTGTTVGMLMKAAYVTN